MTGTVLSFEPIISDQSPEMGVRVDRVMTGTNSKTGAVVKATHAHTAPKKGTSGVVSPNKSYFLKKIGTK